MLESRKRKETSKVLEMLRKAGTPSAVQYQGATGSGGVESEIELFDPATGEPVEGSMEDAVDVLDPDAESVPMRKKRRKTLASLPAPASTY